MTQQLIPLADDLWFAESELRIGVIVFPIRMTVVRQRGRLALISPIAIDDALAAELSALGEVAFLVAPSLAHHVHLTPAVERFPKAELWGPAGLADKRADLTLDAALKPGPTPIGLEVFPIEGAPQFDEHAFFHAPTGTLVVTDLVFNMHAAANWISKVVFRYLSRAYGRVAQSRLWRYATDDREAAGASVGRLLALDFDRLVMAHGTVVETGGRQALGEATTWMRGGRHAKALPAAVS